MRQTKFGTALAAFLLAGAASADTIVVNFDFYPGPDGVLGTGDDVPIVAPTTFASQTLQLTDQFAAVGIVFAVPPVNDRNEILNNDTFTNPPGSTEPNLLAASGTLAIEARFIIPVFEVGAIIGVSGGSDRLEIFDAGGASLGSIIGDDVFVSLTSTTPIARFTIVAATGSTAAIDNLTFVTGTSTPTCYANCDGSTVPPILNVGDFSCFLNAFAGGDSYANCDGSTTPPILNVGDFSCFLNAFAAGCT
jgi:hypothetical protein